MKKSLMVGAVVAVLLVASLVMAASYSDVPSSSIYAPAVSALSKAKIMVGSNGLFNGTATVNRYQLAQTAYNLLNYIEKDPVLAKKQDIVALQTIVNSIVKKLGDTNSIVANLQTEVNSLKVVVGEVQSVKNVTEIAKIVANNTNTISTLQNMLISIKTDLSSQIEKAAKLANINNNMIANQAKEIKQNSAFLYKKIAVATQPIATNAKAIKSLQSQLAALKTKESKDYIALSTEIPSMSNSLSNQMGFVKNDVSNLKTQLSTLQSQLAALKTKESNDYIALSTSIPSMQNSLSNQIGFIKNDLKTTKSQLSNQISNTKIALEQEVSQANKKANLAMWTGMAGIAIGVIGFGTFLYWVWNMRP